MNLLEQASPFLLWSWAVLAFAFTAMWLRQVQTRNASSVDAGWSAAIGLLACTAAIVASGSATARVTAAALAGLWSLRLTYHLIVDRVLGDREEDGRYQALRHKLKGREASAFFLVYQTQALLALGFAAPFVLMSYSPTPGLQWFQLLGIAIAFASQLLEAVADRQLARHRADPALKGRTCRTGLWRFSRHPNYFFEWLTWCGFALVHTAALGWLAAVAPIAMWLTIRFFTGVPFTEKRALVSRGDDYRRYMAETNAFVPWFPRRPQDPHRLES